MTKLWKSNGYALRFFILFLTLFLLSGCASYSKKVAEGTLAFRDGDFATAEITLNEVLEAERHALLRYMELGVIMHEKGNYTQSNLLLEEAYLHAETLYGTSVQDLIMRATTNASMLPYKSEVFEKLYIHYYKILNYIYLSEMSSKEEKDLLLDKVRIEGRRAQILLDDNVAQKGTYKEAEDEEEKIFNKIMKIFSDLSGEVINPKELVFRDNAFIHYVIGVMYEQYGELDNARISYERSARIYEKGYVQQYNLSPEMVDQAKFDTARILKKQRDNRWKQVRKTIKSKTLQQQLNKHIPGKNGSVFIIQEVDLSPPKGELNLYMSLDVNTSILSINPILLGTDEEKAYQLSWFYYMYAPKGILNAIERIHEEGYYNPDEIKPKTINVSLLRPVIDQIPGFLAALQVGVRLAVPFAYYNEAPFQTSLQINSKPSGSFIDSENIAGLQLANALVQAGPELTEAMAVESTRIMTCAAAGILPAEACSLIAASASQADTRSWLTLPHTIRIKRLYLPEKDYQIRIISHAGTFKQEENMDISIKAKELKILRLRSYFNTPKTIVPIQP